MKATFDVDDVTGVAQFTNVTEITPSGMNWNEPGNFDAVNGDVMIVSGSYNNSNQQGTGGGSE
jgi:hypothetical protein